MKKLLYISLFMLALAKTATAQEQPGLRQQADKLYQRYEYYRAVKLYLRSVKKGKNDVQLLEHIAGCYRNINQYDEAGKWYAKAAADPKVDAITHFYYAQVLQRNQKFDQAKAQYRIFFAGDTAGLNRKLADCDSAAAWMKAASDYQVKNFQVLNSEFSDWGLTYLGKTGFIFTSDRVNDPDNLDDRTGNDWFKLYETDTTGDRAILTDIYTKDNVSMSDRYHFGPVAFSASGDTAYVTATTIRPARQLPDDKDKQGKTALYTRRLELLVAVKKDRIWVFDHYFKYNNPQYSVGDAALTPDGKTLYFCSDMPGGHGKTDIWYCEKQLDGTWSKPANCGSTINTAEEDEFPSIGGDGALYYASKGLPGMGGYDIYRAEGQKAQWTAPKNLKYPINSTSDDFYLVTRDGYSGYFSSNRDGGKGNDDIYSFTRLKRPPPTPQTIARKDTPAAQPPPPALPNGLLLGIIYYDLDKSTIRPDAMPEMDKLAALMKTHPALRIGLSSYTDSRASAAYNMTLSRRRAIAAAAYLEERGIDASRLELKYYGETHLVNQCAGGVPCTEPEHQLNRRTEFKIIGGGN